MGPMRLLTPRPLQSLAARIGVFVFAATLTSALAVAGTSAYGVRAFLRSKIEQKIPASLSQVHDRMDLWYAQRSFDVEVFARSATVVDGLSRLAGRTRARERAEVEQYLRYVLESLPQYPALFVLGADGAVAVAVGAPMALSPQTLRALAATSATSISPVLTGTDGSRFQAVSSPVRGAHERVVATLHALLPVAVVEKQLADSVPDATVRTLVFDAEGRFVLAARSLARAPGELPAGLAAAGHAELRDYVASDGIRVVGSKLPFPRLGWTLVVEEDYETAFAPIASILGRNLTLNLAIVGVLSALAFAFAAFVVRPLRALTEVAIRLRDGEPGVELPAAIGNDEVGILTRSFGEMVESLARARESLEQLATTDGLTGIHNHRFFQDRLTQEVERSERDGTPLALLLVDIDDFKGLNDRHGHTAGDTVLVQLARVLVGEAGPANVVARYGGEEFAILAPGADTDEAVRLAEQIRLAVGGRRFEVPPDGDAVSTSVSIGVASHVGDRASFFLEADRALYSAKGAGKDCVVVAQR
jgi:diguanylate cyclase (GGDEF)-like protein